jgi:hypothetical protein
VLASVVELESPAVSRIHPPINMRNLPSRSRVLGYEKGGCVNEFTTQLYRGVLKKICHVDLAVFH